MLNVVGQHRYVEHKRELLVLITRSLLQVYRWVANGKLVNKKRKAAAFYSQVVPYICENAVFNNY